MSASRFHPAVQRMIDEPGIWIIGDSKHKDARVVIWSYAGNLFAMSKDEEPLDPTRFLDTLVVKEGPFK